MKHRVSANHQDNGRQETMNGIVLYNQALLGFLKK